MDLWTYDGVTDVFRLRVLKRIDASRYAGVMGVFDFEV